MLHTETSVKALDIIDNYILWYKLDIFERSNSLLSLLSSYLLDRPGG